MSTFPLTRLRRLRRSDRLRALVRETRLDLDDFVLPLFVGPATEANPELPALGRFSVDDLAAEAERASRASAPSSAPRAPTEPPASTSPTTSSGRRRHGSPPVTPPISMTSPKASAIASPSASATAAASATFDQTSCPSPTSPRASRPTTFSSRSAASDPAASSSARKVIVSPSA